MIVPSIDLMGSQAVQLIGGETHALDAGDPRPLAERFGRVGEVAVIDLDAAIGTTGDDGSPVHNAEMIKDLLTICRCRVGGGIRSADRATEWLDAGAHKVILGTAATPEILRELPRDRVIAALDALNGEVVVKGWREKTGRGIVERIAELRGHVGGFLVTFVEREGRMSGTNLDAVAQIVEAAGDARVTIAGGVSTVEEIAELDRLGADAQVGMALYTGAMSLGDAFGAPLTTDRPDGLWPTVVCDERGVALGLCYSSAESLRESVETGTGVYWSRSRDELWRKGLTSGATQRLLAVDADCDRDALRFTVEQSGTGFCHLDTRTCWGHDRGLGVLDRTIDDRFQNAPAGSYTRRLFAEPGLAPAKLREETDELIEAIDQHSEKNANAGVRHEAADLLYFALVNARRAGVRLGDIEAELDRRTLRVSRRPGNAKPGYTPDTTGATP